MGKMKVDKPIVRMKPEESPQPSSPDLKEVTEAAWFAIKHRMQLIKS